jgi:uncharacterized protein (DUF885 family)
VGIEFREFLPHLALMMAGGLGGSLGLGWLCRRPKGRALLSRTEVWALAAFGAVAVAGLVGAFYWMFSRITDGSGGQVALGSPPTFLLLGLIVGLPLSLPGIIATWSDSRPESIAERERRAKNATQEDRLKFAKDLVRQIEEFADTPRGVKASLTGDKGRVLMIAGDLRRAEGEVVVARVRRGPAETAPTFPTAGRASRRLANQEVGMQLHTGRGYPRVVLASLLVVFVSCQGAPGSGRQDLVESTRYEDLLTLHGDWREFQQPAVTDGVPDYTPAAMGRQRQELTRYQARLAGIDPEGWPISQRVDYHVVRAEMNGLEFDHRVLRPWARNPAFYMLVHGSQSDVPAREGEVMRGVMELWTYQFPLSEPIAAEIQEHMRAIPAILEQARGNLVVDAADLWFLSLRVMRGVSQTLGSLAEQVAEDYPELSADTERAQAAVDDFAAWIEGRHGSMTAPSGVGVEEYDWYLKNVQLLPYTWADQQAIIARELGRSWAYLRLLENKNRDLAELEMVDTEAEYQRQYRAAVRAFVDFLDREDFFTVPSYAEPALMAREGRFSPQTGDVGFFNHVSYRNFLPMRAHGTHWFDLARMDAEPHASPVRRVPLLYNIWSARAEGYATGMEELVMGAGYLDDLPRAQELVYVLLAQRAARALAGLRMHSNEYTIQDAVDFAAKWTPRGWMPPESNTVWGEQQLYLEQPTYGTSYVMGKVSIDKLLADRAQQLGDEFTLGRFIDEFHAAGMIPVSLIRWEMTGLEDEMEKLW